MDFFTDPSGSISVRAEDGLTKLYSPGEWRNGVWVPTPIASLPQDARAVASELWTAAVVASWRDATEPVQPTQEELLQAIKAEARRRIEEAWPIWRQINLQAEGGEAFIAMRAEIDAIRTRSDEIEQMDPLPDDVSADELWLEPAAE